MPNTGNRQKELHWEQAWAEILYEELMHTVATLYLLRAEP